MAGGIKKPAAYRLERTNDGGMGTEKRSDINA